jgi:hypothetical protein
MGVSMETAQAGIDVAIDAMLKALDAAQPVIEAEPDPERAAIATTILGFYFMQSSKHLGPAGITSMTLAQLAQHMRQEVSDAGL